ncbi:hypothetical protein AWE51_18685 [Aquimarina aggregata]|uniref:Peptidase metallopeptidase domain-containing protein n=2 Tax=Aquimarina aggregata TaxID=1642818 RepID=A0A162WG37_9FLAO|nr:M57 family metalloprotease [Aquimarina aggregata]KZS38073.1 hypothetical protein AWE51_18685 [Aquimarina aggregata]
MKLNFFKTGIILLSTVTLLTTSCSNEEFGTPEQVNVTNLPDNVLNKVLDLQMDPSLFNYQEIQLFDGSTKKIVITSGDMAIDVDRFLAIPSNQGGLNAKQYRSQFLIDTDKYPTVDIIAFIGEGPFGLSQLAQDGLVAAVQNWNEVSSKLELTLTFTTEPTFDSDVFEIRVNTASDINSDGLADFPNAEGKPGPFVLINSRVNANFPDGFEHLLTHEIGHAIGFRHTDWNSRQSCVDQGLETESTVENDLPVPSIIFGTLPSIPGILEQENSIMNACFNFRTTDGELNFNDRSGLRFLYPKYY